MESALSQSVGRRPASSILMVEDDPFLRCAIKTLLKDEGFRVHAVKDAEEAWEMLDSFWPDLFLLDLVLPGRSGLEFLKAVRARRPSAHTPALILTGAPASESFQEGMRQGVDFYFTKPVVPETLLRGIDRALAPEFPVQPREQSLNLRPAAFLTDIIEGEGVPHPLRYLVHTDAQELIHCGLSGGGDEANSIVSRWIMDFLYSFQRNLGPERLEAAVTRTGMDLVLSVRQDQAGRAEVWNAAGTACDAATKDILEQIPRLTRPVEVRFAEFTPPADLPVGRALHLAIAGATTIRSVSLAQTPLLPFLQEIYALGSGRLAGYEILCRPQGGGGTATFYNTIESLHLQGEVDRRAIALAAPIIRQVPSDLFISFNITPGSLLDRSFADYLIARLGDQAGRIFLELTERSPLLGTSPVRRELLRCRKAGFGIAMDDVGAGYSNLLGMVEVRPTLIKIDRLLIKGVAKDAYRADAIRSILVLAHTNAAGVVAEGVENAEDMEALRALGMDMVQGYLFHRPAPVQEVLGA